MRCFLTLAFIVLCAPSGGARADYWNLPQDVTPANASIKFEVDSTWHLIEGKAKNFSGKFWLADQKDPQSVKGNIRLPVSGLDTDSESRDEEMRTVMNEALHPYVEFTFLELEAPGCDPLTLSEASPCRARSSGDLKINGVTKRVTLETSIARRDLSYQVSGTTVIRWADFKVEDPSILIAKLHDEVKIQITVSLAHEK